MKIVDLKTFLSLSGNVLYQKYEPEIEWLGPLEIRRQKCGDIDWVKSAVNDPEMIDRTKPWAYQSLGEVIATPSEFVRFQDFSVSFSSRGREATFDEDAMFAVYEVQDVAALIKELQECLRS